MKTIEKEKLEKLDEKKPATNKCFGKYVSTFCRLQIFVKNYQKITNSRLTKQMSNIISISNLHRTTVVITLFLSETLTTSVA